LYTLELYSRECSNRKFVISNQRKKNVFKSKRISLLTILALLIPTSAGFAGIGISAATAEETAVVLSNDVTATIVIDGVERNNGDTIFLDPLTTSVPVQATPTHIGAVAGIVGGTNLQLGANPLTVTVTAEDGVASATYNFTLEVAQNQDANVTDIKIDGVSYPDGSTVELPYGTTSVVVAVTLSDTNAAYTVTGGTGLLQGSQELTINVAAQDRTITAVYGVTLNVADPFVTLSDFKFNGTNVVADSTVHTFAESNTLTLVPTDSSATIVVSGATHNAATGALALEQGVNEITVEVTVGQTTADYVFTVLKATFAVEYQGKYEGSSSPIAVTNGSSITVAAKTADITVDVTGFEATTVEIEGDKNLDLGVNQVYVEVTTVEGYVVLSTFTVTVPKVSTEVSTFTVNDQDVVLSGTTATLTLEEGTTFVEVVVEAFDEESTYVITGTTGLVLGNSNRLVVAVTSSDGDLVTYTVTLIVPASINAAFEKISINGVSFNNEDLIEVDSGVVDVQVDTEQVDATVAVTGAQTVDSIGGSISITGGVITASGFVTLTVVVTAQDGITKSEPVEINLLASTDLGMFNGSNLADDEIRVGTFAKINEVTTKSNFAPNAKLLYKWTVDGIADTSSSTTRLLLRPDHVDTEIRAVVTSGANATLKTIIGKTFVVALGIIKKAPTPSVLGKSAIGLNLKAITKSWSEGVETSYKWYINYENSESEAASTDPEFLLKADDLTVGDKITLGVTGALDGYETVEKFSAQLTVTIGSITITTKPTLAADPSFITGATITANPGVSNVEDAEATFEWSRNGVVIAGADGEEYTLIGADFNKKIAVKVTYALDGYTSAALTVKSPTIKVAALEEVSAPSITKTGNVLTAVDGFSTDAPTTSVQYIWYRNGRAVTDVKTRTYTLKSKDVLGTKFTVRVVGNYLGYVTTSVLSDIEDPFIVGVTADYVAPPVVPVVPVVPAN
jgi:hypothetical protein